MISVLIVDDHQLVRSGIQRLLADVSGIKIAGEAESGEQAVRLSRDIGPNVILMDIIMPGIGGLEATHKILRSDPDAKILILTVCDEEPFPSKLLQSGAAGYLSKGTSAEELIQAIRAVHSGQRYIGPEYLARKLALKRTIDEDESPFKSLSDRELQVMIMITKGLKVQEISDKLYLSPKTVNSYRYRLFEKLNISNDVELTHLAIRHGILDLSMLESEEVVA